MNGVGKVMHAPVSLKCRNSDHSKCAKGHLRSIKKGNQKTYFRKCGCHCHEIEQYSRL